MITINNTIILDSDEDIYKLDRSFINRSNNIIRIYKDGTIKFLKLRNQKQLLDSLHIKHTNDSTK